MDLIQQTRYLYPHVDIFFGTEHILKTHNNLAMLGLAQTQDLELRQTSRDCAGHLEMVLPKLKIMYFEFSLTLNMVVFRESQQMWLPNIIWQRIIMVLNIKLFDYLISYSMHC